MFALNIKHVSYIFEENLCYLLTECVPIVLCLERPIRRAGQKNFLIQYSESDRDHRLLLEQCPTPRKISYKSVHDLLRCTAKCQFTLYLLTVKNPGKWSRIHERISITTKISNRFFLVYSPPPIHQILSKSIHNFLGDILFTRNDYTLVDRHARTRICSTSSALQPEARGARKRG